MASIQQVQVPEPNLAILWRFVVAWTARKCRWAVCNVCTCSQNYAPSKYFTSLFVKKNDGKKRRIKFQSTCQNCLAASKWAQSDHPFWRSRAAYTCLERPGSSAHRSWAALQGIFWLSFHIGATPNCRTSQRPCSLDMFVTKVFQMVTAKWHVQLNPHLRTATQICHDKLLSLLRMESLSHDHGTAQVHVLSKSHSVPIPKKLNHHAPCVGL